MSAYSGGVSKWTGSWLQGPRAALEPGADTEQGAQEWRGQRLGLPKEGPGSISATSRRAGALLIDLGCAALITAIVIRPDIGSPEVMRDFNNWSGLVWFVLTVVAHGFFGFTPGKLLLGVRLVRVDGSALVGVPRAILRALLTALLIPAVIWDGDNRGLHDKASGTLVVRTR